MRLLAAAVALSAVATAAIASPLTSIEREDPAVRVADLERLWEEQYESHLSVDRADALSSDEIAATLARQDKRRTALVYLAPQADRLEIVVLSAGDTPLRVSSPVSQVRLKAAVEDFNRALQAPLDSSSTLADLQRHRGPGKQLYDWLLAPIATDLRARGIDTLLLCTGPGLRSLPFAALNDGETYLIESFALTRIAAFSLTKFEDSALADASVLASGAETFATLPSLPGVPVEVRLTAAGPTDAWLLDDLFTRNRLQRALALQRFNVVHLATHAEFLPGEPATSYIQLWDGRLGLDEMADFGWDEAGVELLVLSACQTAVGDREAELGFAGLAYQSGVGSVVASLWAVSDAGTLALMSEFYARLGRLPTKVEALQAAQTAMLRGELRVERGELRGGTRGSGLALPPEIAGGADLTHPFYWAAFSLIGNPW